MLACATVTAEPTYRSSSPSLHAPFHSPFPHGFRSYTTINNSTTRGNNTH